MKLSIIIPVLNERPHIEGLLSSVMGLDPAPKEILIANGGSQDGTREKVLELGRMDPAYILLGDDKRKMPIQKQKIQNNHKMSVVNEY